MNVLSLAFQAPQIPGIPAPSFLPYNSPPRLSQGKYFSSVSQRDCVVTSRLWFIQTSLFFMTVFPYLRITRHVFRECTQRPWRYCGPGTPSTQSRDDWVSFSPVTGEKCELVNAKKKKKKFTYQHLFLKTVIDRKS